MANSLFTTPIIITAPMAASYKVLTAATLGALSTIRIEKIYWKGPANASDTFMITDAFGDELFSGVASAANVSQIFDWSTHPKLVADFRLSQISSGTIEIYLR